MERTTLNKLLSIGKQILNKFKASGIHPVFRMCHS